eukprot:435209-Amphidinium_carterae.1
MSCHTRPRLGPSPPSGPLGVDRDGSGLTGDVNNDNVYMQHDANDFCHGSTLPVSPMMIWT